MEFLTILKFAKLENTELCSEDISRKMDPPPGPCAYVMFYLCMTTCILVALFLLLWFVTEVLKIFARCYRRLFIRNHHSQNEAQENIDLHQF